MKKSIVFAIVFLLAFHTNAQTTAPLSKVTIYPQGAVLEHNAKVFLKKGPQTILLKGLAREIDAGSILVEIDGYVNVLAHQFIKDYRTKTSVKPDSTNEGKIKLLEKKVAKFQKEKRYIQEQIAIEEKALDIIVKAQPGGGDKSPDPNLLSSYSNLYRDKAYEVQGRIRKLREREELYGDSITNHNEQIRQLRDNYWVLQQENTQTTKSTGYLELQLEVPEELTANIHFSYFSIHATWNAAYDIITENIEKPLKIKYKANIIQNTGLDWNNVKISVSTATPNRSNAQPMFTAWYLDVYKAYTPEMMNKRADRALFRNNEIPSFDMDKKMLADGALPQMVYSDGLSISFDSEMNYSIPSDNNLHGVVVKTFDANCQFKYYTAPKLENAVFLLAELDNYEQYNLLPGEAQIFLEGKFTGKVFIDPFTTAEKINISMGRDNSIVVKRERQSLREKTTFIEGNKIGEYKYRILVKNNKQKDIDLIIKDQYPLTNNAKIVVDQKHQSGSGTVNDTLGVITWTVKIEKGKTGEVDFGYRVTRPKDMVLAGL